jgi:hypothetical protein
LAVSAAAAVTRPAASMLRASGFCASSATFWPASRSTLGSPSPPPLPLLLLELEDFLEPLLPPERPPDDRALAIGPPPS